MEHYRALDASNLLELIDKEALNPNPKVSIYFSVPHASDFAIYGHAEMHSLIQRAARRMTFYGASLQTRLEIEAALNDLAASPSIWEHRVDGYAVFASDHTVRCYGLPQEVNRLVVVNDNFYVRPLVELLNAPHSFYVVDVSLGNVRLVRVMPHSITELPLGEIPWDRTGVEGSSEPIHDRSYHSTRITHGRSSSTATVPHGSHEDAKHAQGKRYLMHAAHLIDQKLSGQHDPLIVLGTESSRGHLLRNLDYKYAINSAHGVHVPDLLHGATRDASGLWQQCATAVKEWQAHTATEDTMSDYHALESIGRATHDVHLIKELAVTGKIDTLLLGNSLTLDGTLTPEQSDENDAIIDTLRHGGRVVERNTREPRHLTAAILRHGAEFYSHDGAEAILA